MKVKDLIWKLEQIHDKEKEVYFGTGIFVVTEKGVHSVSEGGFAVYLDTDD